MGIFSWFNKLKSRGDNFSSSSFEEISNLETGDKVNLRIDGKETIKDTYVKAFVRDGLISFTSGNFVQLNKYCKESGYFNISSLNGMYRVEIQVVSKSNQGKCQVLTTELAIRLTPGKNTLGMVTSEGFSTISVDVGGQLILFDDKSIKINKLSPKGNYKSVQYCITKDTKLNPEPLKLGEIKKSQVVDVYLKNDNYRAVRCYAKEVFDGDGRLVLKYVNSHSNIVLPKIYGDPKLSPIVVCMTDVNRVTA